MVSLPIVLLIFISSNNPQTNLNEGILVPPTAQPQKGFVDNGKTPQDYSDPVNDLTVSDFKFPDDHSKGLLAPDKKIIREKVVPDEKNDKNKTPVPLYSLVKNDCGEGYALDENGVCQKTIAARNGKKLDADRKRRKREVSNYEWLRQKRQRTYQDNNRDESGKGSMECSNLYPGLVADKNGGCKKAIRTVGRPFDKTLPP